MNTLHPALGTCTLVGAGPGDPELLTLKAVKAIADATLLLVDDLVADEILAHANPQARIVHVGKRGGCKSTPQAFIDKLMVNAVCSGERVVRLKGGDPLIFGRGGEEAEHLRMHGIEARVVNGLTAGLVAATALGVPLTHRDRAHGVVFLTGHAKPGEAETDWRTVGTMAHAAKLTLVVYMGVSSVGRIATGLLHGMPSSTPVAIVENASRTSERQVDATLASLVRTVNDHCLRSPAVIIIGDILRAATLVADVSAISNEKRHPG